MIKAIYFFHKKSDLSVEDFQNYWHTTHADLVRQVSGIRRYVQCHTLLSGYRRPTPPPLDGIEEICFDSTDHLALMEETAAGQSVMEDLENFVEIEQVQHIVTKEIEIKPGPTYDCKVKNIELVTRRHGMPIAEFHSYWRDVHGPLAARIEVIKRYVQSHTLMSEYEKEESPAYDGIAETWFTDTAAMRHSGTTPEYAATRADEKNFLTEPLPIIITTELKII